MSSRPCDLDWIRAIRDQSRRHHVAFFLKQVMTNGRMDKSSELDGEIWREFPEPRHSLESRAAGREGNVE